MFWWAHGRRQAGWDWSSSQELIEKVQKLETARRHTKVGPVFGNLKPTPSDTSSSKPHFLILPNQLHQLGTKYANIGAYRVILIHTTSFLQLPLFTSAPQEKNIVDRSTDYSRKRMQMWSIHTVRILLKDYIGTFLKSWIVFAKEVPAVQSGTSLECGRQGPEPGVRSQEALSHVLNSRLAKDPGDCLH